MNFRRLPFLFVLFTLGCSLPQSATPPASEARAETSVKPGINKSFLDPNLDVNSFTERFEGESREIYVERAQILAALQIEPGMVLADIGAGTGLFTGPMAGATGDQGKVYAVDIAQPFLDQIQRRAAEQKLSQIETVLCTEDSVELAGNSIDLAFICDVYHHFEYPRSTLASLFRALRQGGKMVIVDFERIPGKSRDWVLEHVRAGKATTRAEVEAAGFVFVDEVEVAGLKENYLIRFRKP